MNGALSVHEQRLLVELLGNSGEPGSSPSSENGFEKDQVRLYINCLS